MNRIFGRVLFGAVCLVLALLTAGPALASKRKEASQMSLQALNLYKLGEYAKATDFYRRAYKLDPRRPVYLYGAARSQDKAGRSQSAQSLYKLFLELAPADSRHAVKARAHLARLQAASASRKQADAAESRTSALVVLGGGGVTLLAAGIIYALAASDNADLDTELAGHTVDTPVTSLSYTQAIERRESANNRIVLSWALTGVGAALTGVGAWMWTRRTPDPDEVGWQVVPAARGLKVRLAF